MRAPRFRGFALVAIAVSLAFACVASCSAFSGNNDTSTSTDATSNDASLDATGANEGGAITDSSVFPDVFDPCTDGGAHRFMFVTQETWAGDLGATDGGVTGIALANAHCDSAAQAGGLPGTYFAWISTTTSHPTFAERPGVPLLTPTCIEIAHDLPALASGPERNINVSEYGAEIPDIPCYVWCATSPSGASEYVSDPTAATCNEWTSDSPDATGSAGDCTDFPNWAELGNLACNLNDAHLYCVQN